MEPQGTTSGHSLLDVAFTFLMIIAGYTVRLAIHVVPSEGFMKWAQVLVWSVAITSGILAIMNQIGYQPAWLVWIKQKVKKKKRNGTD